MPKISLTAAQKQAARSERQRRKVADGLSVWKNRNRMTNEAMGSALGVSPESVARLLGCEDVKLHYTVFLRILDAAGVGVEEAER